MSSNYRATIPASACVVLYGANRKNILGEAVFFQSEDTVEERGRGREREREHSVACTIAL